MDTEQALAPVGMEGLLVAQQREYTVEVEIRKSQKVGRHQ
jgi:hypothetical protein